MRSCRRKDGRREERERSDGGCGGNKGKEKGNKGKRKEGRWPSLNSFPVSQGGKKARGKEGTIQGSKYIGRRKVEDVNVAYKGRKKREKMLIKLRHLYENDY